MINQDFSIAGASPMIEIYCDRVEISNPGEPIVPVERFIDGYRSRNEHMTNQSLRGRFQLPENKSATVSQIISQTVEAGMIKPDEKVGDSRKHARYVPKWA